MHVGVEYGPAALVNVVDAAGLALHAHAAAYRPLPRRARQAVAGVQAQHVLGRVLAEVHARQVAAAFVFLVFAGIEGVARKDLPGRGDETGGFQVNAVAAHPARWHRVAAVGLRVGQGDGAVFLIDAEKGSREVEPVVKHGRLDADFVVLANDGRQHVALQVGCALRLEDTGVAGVEADAVIEVVSQAQIGNEAVALPAHVFVGIGVQPVVPPVVVGEAAGPPAGVAAASDDVQRVSGVEARAQRQTMRLDGAAVESLVVVVRFPVGFGHFVAGESEGVERRAVAHAPPAGMRFLVRVGVGGKQVMAAAQRVVFAVQVGLEGGLLAVIDVVLQVVDRQDAARRQAPVAGAGVVDGAEPAFRVAVDVVDLGVELPVVAEVMLHFGEDVFLGEDAPVPVQAEKGIGWKARAHATQAHGQAGRVGHIALALVHAASGQHGGAAQLRVHHAIEQAGVAVHVALEGVFLLANGDQAAAHGLGLIEAA